MPQIPILVPLGQLLLWLGIALAIASAPSVLRSRRGAPLSALSWLFALMLFPWIGALSWWFLGREALARRRRKRAATRAEFLERRGQPSRIQLPQAQTHHSKVAISAEAEIANCDDSQVQVLCEGPAAFAAMTEAIKEASECISILYYIWSDDETGRAMRDCLTERASAGVKVRVLLDAIGSFELNRNFWEPLRNAGGRVVHFMPPRIWTRRRPSFNFRNHRKILVVDHKVAFSGGMNVSDHYAKAWKDVHMKSIGAAVPALENIFFEDWFHATGEYLPPVEPRKLPLDPQMERPRGLTVISSGPDSPQPWIHDHYFRAMASAKERLWIATPYFVPTESISTALRTAATRGVDVRILLPGKSDQHLVQWASRAYYPRLVSAGVKIFEYQPAMMHAKVWLIDDCHCAIGSANLDPRSFRLNFELSCLIDSPRIVRTLQEWFEPMLADAIQISEETLAKTPQWKILRDSAAHLWSPLL